MSPARHPDDIFHVIIDAMAIIAKMSPEDLARFNAGRPPWDWYDDLGDRPDLKVTEEGWHYLAEKAKTFAITVLNNGLSENVLGEATTRDAMRRARHDRADEKP